MRRIATALLLPALLLIAACTPRVENVEVQQPGAGAPVEIVTTLCPPGEAAGSCHATNGFVKATGAQLLVGYLVPSGAKAQKVALAGPDDITLTPFDSYAAALEAASPAAPGREWLAFRTETLPSVDDADPKRSTVTATFSLPGATGDPRADFPYEVRPAFRDNADPCDPGDPIDGDCGGTADVITMQPVTGLSLSGTQEIGDLALRADGDRPAVERGGRAQIPFTVRYAGAAPSGDVPVGGSTTIPGATVVPGTFSRASTGDGPVALAVDVPASTPPGVYDATMALDIAGDEVRQVTRQVEVREAPAPPADDASASRSAAGGPPVVAQPTRLVSLDAIRTSLRRVRLLSTRKAGVRTAGLRFVQDLVVPGDATWTLTRRGSTLARLTARVTKAGRRSVRLRLTKRGKRALRGKRATRVSLRTVFVDAQRRRVSVSVPVRLR